MSEYALKISFDQNSLNMKVLKNNETEHVRFFFIYFNTISYIASLTETEPPTTLTTKASTTTTTTVSTTVVWETETLNEGQAIQKALQYLLQHRQPDWGWGNDTHHVMLTLQVHLVFFLILNFATQK